MARVSLLSHLARIAVIAVPLAALTAASTTGCAKLHARAIGPALDTPVAPPRVVPSATEPIESQPIVASPPVGEVQSPTPATIKPPETPAPAPAPPPPPAPAAAIERPAPAPAEPPPTLQTTNPSVAEQRTRVSLASATRDLGRIDTRRLSTDAKAQYDIARRFIAQATDALNEKNFEFAQQLADKAATLAALLQRR
jgi:outer membrane biosynthesis protein TonB